ncbi:hypothetical protein MMC11_009087 [Xylographa trunciseda]|nr:hypothetical protein [Xylographa trunciseda]
MLQDHRIVSSDDCGSGSRFIDLSTTGDAAFDALHFSSLSQPFLHDCRNRRGVVAPQKKRPLPNSTQVLKGEFQPHLKKGRHQDSSTSPNPGAPGSEDRNPNWSTALAVGDTGVQLFSLSSSVEDPGAVAHQDAYRGDVLDYTGFSSIYDSYNCITNDFLPSAPWPLLPCHADPLMDAPLWRFDVDQSTMEEISNVHPADFVALQSIDGLRNLEDFLKSTVTTFRTAGIAFITYNTIRRSIRVQGPAAAAHTAKQKLEDILQDLYGKAELQVVLHPYMKWSNAFASSMRSHVKHRVYKQKGNPRQIQTYTFRSEDHALASAWMECILPSLPGILGPRVGKNYSANLVRIGSSEHSSRACIRIQSPLSQSSYVQQEIRDDIRALCAKAGVPPIRVSFSTGSLTLLAGSQERDHSHRQVPGNDMEEEDVDNPDEGYDDVREFPYHKRWWKYPGPGASIGLRCTRSVSATLGGYILVDGQSFLLTVDHFIDRSQENRYDPTKGDQLELTSPSLSDVDDMSEELRQTMTDIRAHIASLCNDLGSQDLSSDNLPSHMLELQRTYESLRQLRRELDKNDEEFELGKVEHRFKTTIRTSSFKSPSSAMRTLLVNHRLDWALCSINHRQGENRHRYRCVDGIVDTDSDNPMGDGKLCQETGDPEADMFVYFVGQRSGRQRGQVSSIATLVTLDGVDSQEWSIKVHRENPEAEILPGDSGAWVIEEDNEKLVGQIWGLQDGLLLFTPIRVIFADIKETLGAVDVSVHPGHVLPRTAPISSVSSAAISTNAIRICEVKKRVPHKPRVYNLASVPRLRTIENQSPVYEHLTFVRKDESTVGSSFTSSRRTISPIPKLSFSPMSPSKDDFEPLTPSPPPRLMLHYKLGSLSPDMKPEPSGPAIMINQLTDSLKYERCVEDRAPLVSTLQEPGIPHDRTKGDRILIRHLCGDGRDDTGMLKHPSPTRSIPFSTKGKSYTWPITTDRMGLELLSSAIPSM